MRNSMKKFLLAAAALVAVAVAFKVITRVSAKQADEASQAADVVRVTRRDIAVVVKSTGVIKPMVGAEVRVGSSVSGVVSRLFVRIGDRVNKGELLAELDARELIARRDASEAAVRLAGANVSYARADLRRKRELSAVQIIAPSELEVAQQADAVAEQQYKQAQANLADAVTQLSYGKIFAPIGGTVESVSTQEGETVAASFAAPTFVTLLDLSRLEVWAYVDETDIGRIRAGQNASFTVDTYGDYEFAGTVKAIYPQAQIRDNVVDYVTVIRFQSPRDRILRPEMTTTVRIALEQRQNVLALPMRAVHRDGKRQFVALRLGNRSVRRWITTGLRDESYWEVTEGLQENDEVLLTETDKH